MSPLSEAERYLAELDSSAPLLLPGTQLLLGRGSTETALLALEQDLVSLEEQTVLAPQPELLGGRPAEVQRLRARALRNRLEMLRYLNVGSEAALAQALRAFQEDAGLPVEGRDNTETWEVLQEVVTLESPLNLERWYPVGGSVNPVLRRALQLRLQTLGLFPPEVKPDVDPRIALLRFKSVTYDLKLFSPTQPPTERELIALLFDPERLIATLGAPGVPLSVLPLVKVENVSAALSHPRFLVWLARSELWLAGYDVGDIRKPISVRKLKEVLSDFWRDAEPGLSENDAALRSQYINDKLYQAFLRERLKMHEFPAEAIAGFIERNKDWFQRFWEKAILQPISFFWDGLERAGKWLGQHLQALASDVEELFKRPKEVAKALVWNVLRVLFAKASDVLTVVRRAAVAFMDGIQGYMKGEIRASEAPVLVTCGLEVDCDAKLVISADASLEMLASLIQRMQRISRAFDLARLVLLEVASIIARTAQGPVGWILILSSLVRVAPLLVARVQALAES